MGGDLIRQLLRPGHTGTGEVRGAERRDENLRLADFTGSGRMIALQSP